MNMVLKYPGAKWRIADWIISYFPPHKVYLEPFFGSGAVFFHKPPAHVETVNDLNGDVVAFFKILRHRAGELAAQLALTPYARAEYDASFAPADDELEKARRFAVRCHMAYGGSTKHKNGFRVGISPTACSKAGAWDALPDTLRAAAARLKAAQIESKPAEELIFSHNNPETLIYADPPYLLSTRAEKRLYKNEMRESEHESLLHALKDSKSKVILSGYDSELYNDILRGWPKFSKSARAENGLARTEYVWLNYDPGFLPQFEC